MNGAQFRLYGGVNVIGGTKLHVESGADQVLFDFGSTFSSGLCAFDSVLKPRPLREVEDQRAIGMVPDLPGIYKGADQLSTLAIFISHFHLDHVGLLSLLDRRVPIYMSEPSRRLLRELVVIGEGVGEHDDVRVFEYGEKVLLGNMEIAPLPVDHDIPGATGFIVATPSGTLAYTGDFRGHGLHPELTTAFFDRLGETEIQALVSEGTRAGEDPALRVHREAEVPSEALRVAERRRSHVFFTLYNRNIERIGAFAGVARELARKLVLFPDTHHLFRTLAPLEFQTTQPVVYQTHKHSVEGLPSYLDGQTQKVSASDIARNPDAFLLELPYHALSELVDIKPVLGSVYIHSDGVPLGAYDPAFANLKSWLKQFGVELAFVRSSGHASPSFLGECVMRAQPDILYATHTMHPERMPSPPSGMLVLPQLYRSYPIGRAGGI